MSATPFDGMTPTRVLWVSATAPAGGDGSAAHPFNNIQLAVNKSTPGTAVMVKAGTYNQNVLITSQHSGTATAPIWLVSADGPGAAVVVAKDQGMAAIGAGGVSNLVIEGFHTVGGKNGIQISQDGLDWTKMVNNVVVQGNTIEGAKEDGIKANGGDAVYALDNLIKNGEGQQGIDYLAINNGVIANNEIAGITGTCGIYVKGGCYNDTITGNYIHDTVGDGIGVGWHTGDFAWRPGFSGYEASHITVTDNKVVNAGGRALVVHGGVDSTITGNYFGTNGHYYTIAINSEKLAHSTIYSGNDVISNNVLASNNQLLNLEAGNSTGLVMQNDKTGVFTGQVGVLPVSLLHVSPGAPSTTVSNSGSAHAAVSASGSAYQIGNALDAYLLSLANASGAHTSTVLAASTGAEHLAPTAPVVADSHASTYVAMLDAAHMTAFAFSSEHII